MSTPLISDFEKIDEGRREYVRKAMDEIHQVLKPDWIQKQVVKGPSSDRIAQNQIGPDSRYR